MTRDEALKRLRELGQPGRDPETTHVQADNVLLALINDDEISEAWAAIEKWYA